MALPNRKKDAKQKALLEFRGPYEFLSNFYRYEFKYEGVKFPTSEHAYQYMKASMAESDVDRKKILGATTPLMAKHFGKEVKCNIGEWDTRRVDVMYDILRAKFTGPLSADLLATGSANLCERNHWHDNFWGECYCTKCANKKKHNNLGLVLMRIRSELAVG